MQDEMPWRPQTSDLEPEKFKMPSKLNEFLTCLLAVNRENELSHRSARLRHSLAQDIVYIVTSESENSKKFITSKCHQNTYE